MDSAGGGERLASEAWDWYGGAGDCGGRAERGGRCPLGSIVVVVDEGVWYQRMHAVRRGRVL